MSTPDHREQTQVGYDTVAADYASLLPALTAETRLDIAMIDDFADRCASARPGLVVDAGCGTGRISAHLAAAGLDVLGVDLSPGMIEVARRAHPHLVFDVGALEELPVPDAAAGGLLAWYSLIHTAPGGLPILAAEFARILRPGSWMLTAFQAGDGQRVERASAYGHPVAMTNYLHDLGHVQNVLETAGFHVHAWVQRAAEGTEKTPQSILLARRDDVRRPLSRDAVGRGSGASPLLRGAGPCRAQPTHPTGSRCTPSPLPSPDRHAAD